MANKKEKRIKELYDALGNPEIDGALARIYMAEYLHLTGKSEDGYWLFLTKHQARIIAKILNEHEQLRNAKILASIGLGLIAGAYVFSKSSVWKKRDPVQDRIDWLCDPTRIESYTTKQFQAAMAEVSVLVAKKAMGVFDLDDDYQSQVFATGPFDE